MEQILTGTVHGNSIILDAAPLVPDGQQVEVVVRTLEPERRWGEGIKDSAGGWANHPELDAIMEQIHAERALERRSANGL